MGGGQLPYLGFFLVFHDPLLVALAAVVCAISAYACMSLAWHASHTLGRMRDLWTVIAAFTVGFGIWATHFVGMLAFRPGFQLSHDLGLTSLSLVIAIGVCGVGIAFAIRGKRFWDHFLGGAVLGVAISTMHYTGIAALVMGGTISWNGNGVAASVIAGIVLGGSSFATAMSGGRFNRALGAALLTLAICAMHFTAMGAANFDKCFPLSAKSGAQDGWLAVAVASISLLIVSAAIGSALLDDADRRRTAREKHRQLADAARIAEISGSLELALTHMAQGLSLYDAGGYLRLYNAKLPALLGIDPSMDLTGLSFRQMCHLSAVTSGNSPSDLTRLADDAYVRHMALITAKGGELVHRMPDERTLRINHSVIGDGSWVSTVEDITESQRSVQAIAHLARHDVLTGLPNRALFNERFEAALVDSARVGSELAVIAIDLDQFKEVNDSYGHAAGDHVLKTLADRLSESLKEGEIVARLGGDEFAALKSFADMEALREFITRLEDALFSRISVNEALVDTRCSIGVAIFPGDGTDRSKLLSNADLAMYRAKVDFDHHICFYESQMDEQARERRDMARDIWMALGNKNFYLAYQVQKSVSTGMVTGYEVLLRWDRPGFGNVSPALFIPVAEECGAVIAIGDWVLQQACHEAASWPEPHKIAVNISGLHLNQFELVETVQDALLQSGLAPNRLELEVTETAIIADKKRALQVLQQIKALGVSIAIDDFGTGYSSLETLRSFPFDKIKLDRSFMTQVEVDEQSKAIIRAILALGRSLRVPVLAEGVETEAQLDILRLEGCDEVQGFLFGRPGTIEWENVLGRQFRA